MKSPQLPYWGQEYVNHIKAYRPNLYRELKQTGQLQSAALAVQSSAQEAYQQLLQVQLDQGIAESTAKALAQNEVMRQYICLPTEADVPTLGEGAGDLPEEADGDFDPLHRELLSDLNQWWSAKDDPDA